MSHEVTVNAATQYREIERQLNDVAERATSLFSKLHSYQLNLRPESEVWSVADCLEHLSLFSEAFIPIIAECNTTGEKTNINGPFKMDLMGRFLKAALEPPVKLRADTSATFRPTLHEPIDALLPRFVRLQHELIEQIRSSQGLNLARVQVTSPVSKRIRYNLFSCFHIIAAHQRRHLWQAEQVCVEVIRN